MGGDTNGSEEKSSSEEESSIKEEKEIKVNAGNASDL